MKLKAFTTTFLVTTILGGTVCLIPSISWARGGGGHGGSHGGSVSVHGYTRSNGTYVAPYTRSAPSGGSGYNGSGYSGSSDTFSTGDPETNEILNNPYQYYMKKGYAEIAQRNYESASFYFQMALSLRPSDSSATKALASVASHRRSTSTDGSAGQPNLNAQLQQAICTQNWSQAIQVVDKMKKVSTSEYASQLTIYRGRLEALANSKARVPSADLNCSADGIAINTP